MLSFILSSYSDNSCHHFTPEVLLLKVNVKRLAVGDLSRLLNN